MNHTPQESRERVIREFRERFGNSPDDEEGYWIPDTTRHADATPTTWEDIETFLTSALAVECAIAERHATHSLITHAMQQIEARRTPEYPIEDETNPRLRALRDGALIADAEAIKDCLTILQSLLPEQNIKK